MYTKCKCKCQFIQRIVAKSASNALFATKVLKCFATGLYSCCHLVNAFVMCRFHQTCLAALLLFCYYHHYFELEKLLDPQWLRMMPLPGIQIYLQPHVTLTFDLLTLNVDSFMPLPFGPLVPICIKIGLFVIKIL